jgi:hypothetical protein
MKFLGEVGVVRKWEKMEMGVMGVMGRSAVVR